MALCASINNSDAYFDHIRTAGLAPYPLSPWYVNAKPQQGLLLGFANVMDEQDARRLAVKPKEAFPSN
jgi:GntR family transcriptional regulator/MocR family aminotransferase